ncbi:MAG: hypothetical protein HKL99_10485 [Burkholderiales bacterium]|nr:hypothetical protein [Burkholderiales bacterium]
MSSQTTVVERLALRLAARPLAGPEFHALGAFADALDVESVDADHQMLSARAELGSRQRPTPASLRVELAPGQVRLTLTLPASLSSGVEDSIAALANCQRVPQFGGEAFLRCADIPHSVDADDLVGRIVFEIRHLWFTALQVLVNLDRLGSRTSCAILSERPIDEATISRACGNCPVSTSRAEAELDDNSSIATLVYAMCDATTLRAGLKGIPGVTDVIG